MLFIFFFKLKTAYEVRISDWSSDVCSSDLRGAIVLPQRYIADRPHMGEQVLRHLGGERRPAQPQDRLVEGDVRLRILAHVFCRRFEIGSASCRDRVCKYV